MALNRATAAVLDDDGTGTVGTIINNAWKQLLEDEIDGRWSSHQFTNTGSVNNLTTVSGGIESDLMVFTGSANLTITGFAAPAAPAKIGKRLVIFNGSAFVISLPHASGSSSVGNQLFNIVASAATPVGPGGNAQFVYDQAGFWRLVDHEQGSFVQSTFAAGNFIGNGAMTFTLASGDRVSSGYWLRGKQLRYFYRILNASVGGTPNTTLSILPAEFGGFTLNSTVVYHRASQCLDNGTLIESLVDSTTNINFTKAAGGNWTASTDNTALIGIVEVPVT